MQYDWIFKKKYKLRSINSFNLDHMSFIWLLVLMYKKEEETKIYYYSRI